jgi:thiol:disulfide interchange protein DsbD
LRFGWLGAPKASSSDMAGIPWLHDEHAAIAQSRATGKPLLVDFSADWCAACKELDTHTWSDPQVAREAERFVPLKIDATDEAVMDHVQKDYAVPGLPTVLMMACNNPQPQCSVPQDGPGRITGFLSPPEMLERMRRVQ